jgi:membrane protein required for colicin V production
VTDSAVGPVDRTLGLVYGLARGLVLVVLAWLFYIWLIPPERHDPAVQNAKSLPLVQAVGDVVISFLPSEIAQTLQGKTGTGAGASSSTQGAAPRGDAEEGYSNTQQRQIDQIIESTQGSGGQSGGGQDQ